MIRLERILCAFDFSELGEEALATACSLVPRLDARLTVLHVIEPVPGLDLPQPMVEGEEVRVRDDLEHVFERIAATRLPGRARGTPSWELQLRRGRPSLEIPRAARELEADLLVLGARGRTGVSRIWIGSVAESTVRMAACPVLTVRSVRNHAPLPKTPLAHVKTILVPTDFSEGAAHAFEYAALLARRFDARIFLFHASEDATRIPLVYAPQAPFPVPLEEVRRNLLARARRELDRFLAERVQDGLNVRPLLIECRSAFRAILWTAQSESADLIVMGTHGRSGLPHLLLGSVAERVLRAAPCPVLTVRNPRHLSAGG
jgi:nucleotide-binding universal stress UspA family protein